MHNIGRGPRIEDALLRLQITGHYRYFPDAAATGAVALEPAGSS